MLLCPHGKKVHGLNQDPKKQNNNRPSPGGDDDRRGKRILLLVIAALIATLLINSLMNTITSSYLTEIRYDEFLDMLDRGEVHSVAF